MNRPELPTIALAALLTTTWPNGHIQKTPCVDNYSCDMASRFDLARGALSAEVTTDLSPAQAGFRAGWDCIQEYNCASAQGEK